MLGALWKKICPACDEKGRADLARQIDRNPRLNALFNEAVAEIKSVMVLFENDNTRPFHTINTVLSYDDLVFFGPSHDDPERQKSIILTEIMSTAGRKRTVESALQFLVERARTAQNNLEP